MSVHHSPHMFLLLPSNRPQSNLEGCFNRARYPAFVILSQNIPAHLVTSVFPAFCPFLSTSPFDVVDISLQISFSTAARRNPPGNGGSCGVYCRILDTRARCASAPVVPVAIYLKGTECEGNHLSRKLTYF